jgi:NodT family efflux transporter outer membrane factor (OMF) lipoprotein
VQTEAHRVDAAYLALTGNVALEALRIATLRAQIEAAWAAVANDRQINDMVAAAERAGGEPRTAISGGQAQLAQDEAQLPPLRSQLAQSRHRLAMLAGKAPGDWSAPDFELADFTLPVAIPVSLPSALVAQRPDILAAQADLHAATAEIGIQTAALYPDLRLTAGLTQSAITPEDLFGYSASGWNLGAGLAAPLFHGGTLRANRRAAEADARAAMARYQGTVINAFVQVADTLQSLEQGDQALAALTRAEKAAQSSLIDRQNALRLGGGSMLDVIDSQRQLARARQARVQAQGERYMSAVRLFAATAADWRDPPGAVASR